MTEEEEPQLYGGINLKAAASGGTEFEVKYVVDFDQDDLNQRSDYDLGLLNYLNMDCLSLEDQYEGEPFERIGAEMDDLRGDGAIKKSIIRTGYGARPDPGSKVKIHYNAYIQYQAEPFDSTYARKKPHVFKIGEGEVIEGLDISVQSMLLNEKAQFLIEPELAYRNSGLNRVPPNSVVLFIIELLEVREIVAEASTNVDEKDFDYVFQKAMEKSYQAKKKFQLKDFQGALREYKIAAEALEDAVLRDYEDQEKCEKQLVQFYSNALICSTHLEIPKKGCIFAQKIYSMAKNKTFQIPCKVFFNHARCLRLLADFNRAERTLAKAQKMEPQNPDVCKEFELLKIAKAEHKKRETALGKALVNG